MEWHERSLCNSGVPGRLETIAYGYRLQMVGSVIIVLHFGGGRIERKIGSGDPRDSVTVYFLYR